MYRFFLLTVALFFLYVNTNAQAYDEVSSYIPASPAANAKFGSDVSIFGEQLVVGIPKENKVIVYTYGNSQWQQTAVLTASDAVADIGFGLSVDIYGDVIVVGAPGLVVSNQFDCSAYVFVKPAEGWKDMTQTGKLTRTLTEHEQLFDNQAYDYFGGSVAVYNNTIVIGAYKYNSDANPLCGGVFVYEKPESGWCSMTETAHLSASDETDNLDLGRAVEICEDIIVAGEGRMNTGSACYLYKKPVSGWMSITESAKLTPEVPEATFGCDISMDGDVIVVGAEYAQGFDISTGAAYVFVKPLNGWTSMHETAFLTQSDALNGDNFGSSVSIAGNFVIAGTPEGYDRLHGTDGGMLYFFEKSSEGWNDMTETALLYASDANDYDQFGYSVVNTNNDIFVGAISTDKNALTNSGSVYKFNYIFEPQDILLSNNAIDECSPKGKAIGKFTAIDGNRYDIHTYELVSDGTNNFDNEAFVIDGDSLLLNANLDFEKKNLYTLYVKVTDTTNLSYSEGFEIDIRNIEPVLADSTTFAADRDALQGTLIGSLDCTGDTNSVWFEIEYNNYGVAFEMDSITGDIVVNNPDAVNPFHNDYFDLEISVSDGYYTNEGIVIINFSIYSNTSSLNNERNDILIFPNPSVGKIQINFPAEDEELKVKILSSDGRIVLERNITNNEAIDLSALSSGLYYIQAKNQVKAFVLNTRR